MIIMGQERKIHKCTYMGCKSFFRRPYRLAQHLLVHQNVKQFCCSEQNCSKSYTNKTHLIRHIKSVHYKNSNEVIYSCPECLAVYSNRQNLKRHLKTHQSQRLSCDICKKTFTKKSVLQAHIYTHTGVKQFSCEVCAREFVSNFEKNKHRRHHKVFNCSLCDLKFQHWSKYIKHQRLEHRTSEFICNDCGRKFKKRAHIVRHVKIHMLDLKFKCPYKGCERTYRNKHNLNQHQLIKHENFGYVCTICEVKLSSKQTLRLHNEKIHNAPKEKTRNPKTLATGRRHRKDVGVYKTSMALKLSGLAQVSAIKEIDQQSFQALDLTVSKAAVPCK